MHSSVSFKDYLISPQNIGAYLRIDELSLSKGELYTFVTNKQTKGKHKTLVAVIIVNRYNSYFNET